MGTVVTQASMSLDGYISGAKSRRELRRSLAER